MDNKTLQTKDIKIEEAIRPLLTDKGIDGEMFVALAKSVSAAKNQMQYLLSRDIFTVDDEWVNAIDTALYSIEKIAKTPSSGIIEERLVVPVEKAKKTNAETMRHLSSHTSYIRGYTEEGMIRPSKVLTIEYAEDKQIYENRFVYTLIKRLISFIESRFEAISEKMDTYDTHQVAHTTSFKLDKSQIDYKLELSIKQKGADKENAENTKKVFEKVKMLQQRILVLQSTPFYLELSKSKPILPPIMKTNMLTKNVDYGNCYKLWLFISGYQELGFFVDVKDQKLPVENDYFDDLTLLTALSVKSLLENSSAGDDVRKIAETADVRRFKVVDKISYVPSEKSGGAVDKDNLVNQYYLEKLKSLVNKAKTPPKTAAKTDAKTIARPQEINPSFKSFYKSLTELNNKLFQDVLKLADPNTVSPTTTKKSQLQIRKQKIKESEDAFEKQKLLTKLMTATLAAQKTKESKEAEKLEKAKVSLEKFIKQEEARKLAEEQKALAAKEKAAALKQKQIEAAKLAKQKKIDAEIKRKQKAAEEKKKAEARAAAAAKKAQKEKELALAAEKKQAQLAAKQAALQDGTASPKPKKSTVEQGESKPKSTTKKAIDGEKPVKEPKAVADGEKPKKERKPVAEGDKIITENDKPKKKPKSADAVTDGEKPKKERKPVASKAVDGEKLATSENLKEEQKPALEDEKPVKEQMAAASKVEESDKSVADNNQIPATIIHQNQSKETNQSTNNAKEFVNLRKDFGRNSRFTGRNTRRR